jgi:uncharacterized membrane protein YhaH (DUF805 family)
MAIDGSGREKQSMVPEGNMYSLTRLSILFKERRIGMNWYFEVIKKYAVFSGRARRKEYWMFVLVNFVIAIGLGILVGIATSMDRNSHTSLATVFNCISSLYSLAILLPSLGVFVRRLHDIGKSGWWFFIGFIPLIGEIWLLVLMCTDGQPGSNQYGPNPKEVVPSIP